MDQMRMGMEGGGIHVGPGDDGEKVSTEEPMTMGRGEQNG